MAKKKSKVRSNLSEAEYERFAERFAGQILDPRQPWLIQYILTGGLAKIPTHEELSSSEFAFKMLTFLGRDTELWEERLYEAFTKRDRLTVVAWLLERTLECRLTRDEMGRLLACGNSTVLRRSLKDLSKTITFSPGVQPKIRAMDYKRLVDVAQLLEPAILHLIKLPTTKRTLSENLGYLKKDHARACKFLSRYVAQLQRALDDTTLFLRAKKHLPSRARVLAEALAGSEYELRFSTSREFVRRAKALR